MITESMVYWITRLDYFQEGAITIGVVLMALYVIAMFIGGCIWSEDNNKRPFCCIFPTFLIPLILLVGSMFIPNTKEMCAIKVIPKIVNNEQAQELPEKIVNLANEWIEELRPDKEVKTEIVEKK